MVAYPARWLTAACLLLLIVPFALADDPLPPRAVARLGTTRFRHAASVTGIAVAPDGKTIISASGDRSIRFWDLDTGKGTRRVLGHADGLSSLALSADGKTIFSGSADQTVRFWDATTGKERHRLGDECGRVHFLALTPDGKTLAWGSEDRVVHLADTATGKELRQLVAHEGRVTALGFSPDGKTLASGGVDRRICVWEVATGKEQRRMASPSPVQFLGFGADGKTVLSCGGDGTLRLWDVAGGRELQQRGGKPGAPAACTLSADRKTLAWAPGYRKVELCDASSLAVIRALDPPPVRVGCLAFSADGKILVAGSPESSIHVWDVATGKRRPSPSGHQGWVKSVAFTPDGKTLVTAGTDGTVRTWDVAKATETRKIAASPTGTPVAAALTRDGKIVAAVSGISVGLWDTASGRLLRRPNGSEGSYSWFSPVAFAPDGKTLATGAGSAVVIWDVASGNEVRRWHGSGSWTNSIAFAPDGKVVAVGGTDNSVRLWDPANGTLVRLLNGHTRLVSSVAFSPDGKMLASWGGDRVLRLWETATGKERRQFFVGRMTGLIGYSCVAFSPNGKLLAAGNQDKTIRIWELATGKELGRLVGHTGWVRSLAFAPDGKQLASGGDDTTALIWDVSDLSKESVGLRVPLTPAEVEALWKNLAETDAIRAYRSLCMLAGAPRQSFPFLRQQLAKGTPADAEKLTRLIRNLDDDEFEVREQASAELARLGSLTEPALRRALADSPSVEVRSRVQGLLDKITTDPAAATERLREGRVVELLEQAGSAEARQLLEFLSRRPWVRDEARAALARLARRTPP